VKDIGVVFAAIIPLEVYSVKLLNWSWNPELDVRLVGKKLIDELLLITKV